MLGGALERLQSFLAHLCWKMPVLQMRRIPQRVSLQRACNSWSLPCCSRLPHKALASISKKVLRLIFF